MGFFFKSKSKKRDVRASASSSAEFYGFDDPRFLEFVRNGGGSATNSGITISPQLAMKNTAVLRAVSLISFSIGMLPLHLQNSATKEKATDHSLFRLLHRKPNSWMTAMEFRTFMQQNILTKGDACALKIMSGERIVQLIPLKNVDIVQNDDWSLTYKVQRNDGRYVIYGQKDIFHVRNGLSEDGFTGLSFVAQAAEAIALSLQAERSTAQMFKEGLMSGGALEHPGELSPEAQDRLRGMMEGYKGAANAHRWMILEEGMSAKTFPSVGREGQGLEQREMQIAEIARTFGVPRPLLMMDETSWGSGTEVLGQFFVKFGLNPMFEIWQQAISRDLLTEREQDELEPKFNAGALLRGSMKDQAEFFAKGLGSGGHQPWLHPDEPREWMDLPARSDLPAAMGADNGGQNEP